MLLVAHVGFCMAEPEILGKILLGQKLPKMVKNDPKMEALALFCRSMSLDLGVQIGI